jgi:uncharacterized protein (DUF1778 family)
MKTDRLTLLLTPAEKDRINRQAKALGVSASEFVRTAANVLDAEDLRALEEVRALLPEFNAAVDRIHRNFEAALDHALRHEREIARMRAPAYREEVEAELEAADDLVGSVASLFNGSGDVQRRVQPAGAFEASPKLRRAAGASLVKEERAEWGADAGAKPEERKG